ncbi:MAG TPA: DUF6035 family protein [Mucilaginibacter sp.]|nr:DUF6035 family protein [Mucilaginibacter sp.]
MSFQRSIDLAYDKTNGDLYDADASFKVAKEGYELRTRYNSGELNLFCCRCDQPLIISDSKNDRLYFKHFPNAGYCDLKDGKMSTEEVQDYNDILRARERPRHKYLKNRIAELLMKTEGVDPLSVIADTRFFFNEVEKRRPDVYCIYQGKQMAFEIQLSNLSQRYLLGRHKFYSEEGIYLVWILDQFDVHGQSTMERDIKYLTPSQNFFKLDESVDVFRLSCTYKSPFITKEDQILSPWQTRSVALPQVQFDPATCQIYYLHYEQKLKETQRLLQEKIARDEQKVLEERMAVLRETAEKSAAAIIEKLKFYKSKDWNFYKFDEELDRLSPLGLEALNSRFMFATKRVKGMSLINHYIFNAGKLQHSFIHFLLRDRRIEFDINAANDDGTTTFQQILQNPYLDYLQPLVKSMFKRGYRLTEEDISVYNEIATEMQLKNHELKVIQWCDQLKDKSLVDDIYKHLTFLFSIESTRRQQIIGFNYKNWISFAVQAVIKHKQYWIYIERSFKRYGLWEIIEAHDKNKSFQKQMAKLMLEPPEQDVGPVYPLIRELYNDIA